MRHLGVLLVLLSLGPSTHAQEKKPVPPSGRSRAEALRWATRQLGNAMQPCDTPKCVYNKDDPGVEPCNTPAFKPDDEDRKLDIVSDGHLYWYYYCARFVRLAYAQPEASAESASALCKTLTLESGKEIPEGALVFWRWEDKGHVGLYAGGGKVIHTGVNKALKEKGIRVSPLAEITEVLGKASYLGWSDPTLAPLRWGPPPAREESRETTDSEPRDTPDYDDFCGLYEGSLEEEGRPSIKICSIKIFRKGGEYFITAKEEEKPWEEPSRLRAQENFDGEDGKALRDLLGPGWRKLEPRALVGDDAAVVKVPKGTPIKLDEGHDLVLDTGMLLLTALAPVKLTKTGEVEPTEGTDEDHGIAILHPGQHVTRGAARFTFTHVAFAPREGSTPEPHVFICYRFENVSDTIVIKAARVHSGRQLVDLRDVKDEFQNTVEEVLFAGGILPHGVVVDYDESAQALNPGDSFRGYIETLAPPIEKAGTFTAAGRMATGNDGSSAEFRLVFTRSDLSTAAKADKEATEAELAAMERLLQAGSFSGRTWGTSEKDGQPCGMKLVYDKETRRVRGTIEWEGLRGDYAAEGVLEGALQREGARWELVLTVTKYTYKGMVGPAFNGCGLRLGVAGEGTEFRTKGVGLGACFRSDLALAEREAAASRALGRPDEAHKPYYFKNQEGDEKTITLDTKTKSAVIHLPVGCNYDVVPVSGASFWIIVGDRGFLVRTKEEAGKCLPDRYDFRLAGTEDGQKVAIRVTRANPAAPAVPPKEKVEPTVPGTDGTRSVDEEPAEVWSGHGFKHGSLMKEAGKKLEPATVADAQYTHPGIDFGFREGTPFPSPVDGTVVKVEIADDGHLDSFGNAVLLEHDSPIRGRKTFSVYLHFRDPPEFRPGQKVRAGDVLGKVGQTGAADGPHVHIEVRHFEDWLCADPRWKLDGSTRQNIRGPGVQRYRWFFYEDWEHPEVALQGRQWAVRANDRAEEVHRKSQEWLRRGNALTATAPGKEAWDEAVGHYLQALYCFREMEHYLGERAPTELKRSRAVIYVNVAAYWSHVHTDADEAVLWLGAAFREGILDTFKLSDLQRMEEWNPIREHPKFRAMMEKHR